jgi:hypothetical protein
MESSSESNLSPKQSSKPNHSPPNAPAIHASSAIAVKKEEPEDDRVDPAIAIFDDVDGDTTDDESELVDREHVGFVEHNGVNCWVCPGLFLPYASNYQIKLTQSKASESPKFQWYLSSSGLFKICVVRPCPHLVSYY